MIHIRDLLTPGLKKAAAVDKRPILEAVGLQLVSITKRSFNEPAFRAAPWAPLKRATIAAKIKAGESTAILKANALLCKSWAITSLTNSSVTVSTDRPYATTQQFGAKKGAFGLSKRGRPIPWGDIPARPMLPFIGGPEDAKLAPWAREKLSRIAQAKLDSLLKT